MTWTINAEIIAFARRLGLGEIAVGDGQEGWRHQIAWKLRVLGRLEQCARTPAAGCSMPVCKRHRRCELARLIGAGDGRMPAGLRQP